MLLLSVLLMLLMLSEAQAAFLGHVSSVVVRDVRGGQYEVISQEKTSFSSCDESGFQYCQPINGCYLVESSGEWCQKDNIQLVANRLLQASSAATSNWAENINNITTGRRDVYYEQRNRSDIGKPNSAPQTTIIPIVRVPSNCQKNITLLTFDSNGDEVKCRYAAASQSECVECTPPSVLGISPSCSLSFNPTNSSAEGSYVVQMIMEDFPRQTIALINFSGSQLIKTTNDFISKTAIKFLLKVVPAVPSCTEGLILPTFLPPTPDHRTQINATVNQMLEIPIRAEATRSMITMLLFSGPPGVVRSSAGPGNYSLTWTPSDSDYRRSHPICFIVQANYSGSMYHSDLRCLVVTVENTLQTPATAILIQTTAAERTTTTTMTTAPLITTTAEPTTTIQTTTMTPLITTTAEPTTTIQTTTMTPLITTTAEPTTIQTTTMTPLITTTAEPTTIQTTTMTPLITAAQLTTTHTTTPTSRATTSAPESYIIALNAKISTSLSPISDYETIVKQLKDKLIDLGLPSIISVRILNSNQSPLQQGGKYR